MEDEPDPGVAREKIADTARGMLARTLSFIEGARLINQLRWYAELPDLDPDVVPFVGIDDQTDALPFGDVRKLWASDALAKIQPEIDRLERWAAEFGRPYCQRLIVRFGLSPSEP